MPVELEPLESCPGCGTNRATPTKLSGTAIDIVPCPSCGLRFATGVYPSESLDDHYADRATRTASTNTVASRRGSERKGHTLELYDRLSGGVLLAPRVDARALDVGCNTGLFLDLLREAGYTTVGIERSAAGQEALDAGHEVYSVDVEERARLGRRFDLITMSHLLEHLRRPRAALDWVAAHLRPGGIAIIEVPNWDDLARPLWGLRYRPLELGDHVSFFTPETLASLIQESRLQLESVWSGPQARTLLFPSLLSALDLGLDIVAKTRGRGDPNLNASARIVGSSTPRRFALVSRVLQGLDRLDPLCERLLGADWGRGANIVAVLRHESVATAEEGAADAP